MPVPLYMISGGSIAPFTVKGSLLQDSIIVMKHIRIKLIILLLLKIAIASIPEYRLRIKTAGAGSSMRSSFMLSSPYESDGPLKSNRNINTEQTVFLNIYYKYYIRPDRPFGSCV